MSNMKKSTFMKLWGESVKQPLQWDAELGWKAYQASSNKDLFSKVKETKITKLNDDKINTLSIEIAKKNPDYISVTIMGKDEKIDFLLEHASEFPEVIDDKTTERLKVSKSDADKPKPISETIINTEGIRQAIVNEPKILQKVHPELIFKEKEE